MLAIRKAVTKRRALKLFLVIAFLSLSYGVGRASVKSVEVVAPSPFARPSRIEVSRLSGPTIAERRKFTLDRVRARSASKSSIQGRAFRKCIRIESHK